MSMSLQSRLWFLVYMQSTHGMISLHLLAKELTEICGRTALHSAGYKWLCSAIWIICYCKILTCIAV